MSGTVRGSNRRFEVIDAVRGLAIIWMAGYHLSFDLNLYRLFPRTQDFYEDPFWTMQRTGIVSLFLCCAALGQSVAIDAGLGWPRFWRRWSQVAGCAVLVSLGSAYMFPQSWISFGVLHGIALMLLLCRLITTRERPLPLPVLLVGGAMAILLPRFVHLAWFDRRWSNWFGLVTHKPITEDWVPLLPWFGVFLWGLAAGEWLLRHRRAALARPIPRALRPLAVLGRWSLSFYMVHQLVFLGVLQGGRALQLW